MSDPIKNLDADTSGDTEAVDPNRNVEIYDKIPVSKAMGSTWRARYKQAVRKRKNSKLDEVWNQAVRYYEMDQIEHRANGADARAPGNGLANRISDEFSETENLVFTNTNSIVTLLYGKNPGCEVTAPTGAKDMEAFATQTERLINILMSRRDTPGVNAKYKIRRAILTSVLCNAGYIEAGWTFKENPDQATIGEMEQLVQKLQDADSAKEISEIEGQIMVLLDQQEIYEEEGPWLRFVPPSDVLRDPNSIEEDLSDAEWVMIKCMRPTKWVIAKFGQRTPDGAIKSLYQPTHTLPVDESRKGLQLEPDSEIGYDSFDPLKSSSDLGYSSDDEYKESQVTALWYVWHKTTRMVYIFNQNDWKWPIWVLRDPYGLPQFFPIASLSMYQSVKGGESKGEVTYYLDQQDGVNLINSYMHQARSLIMHLFYDKNKISREDAEKLLHPTARAAVGIDVPDGVQLPEVMPHGIKHPVLEVPQLLDKSQLYQAIDRASAVNEVMRGGQFKTNTTNDAVQAYQASAQNRFDDLTDRVEDFVGAICHMLAVLCWKNMDPDMVLKLMGEAGQGWRNLTDEEIAGISVQIEGGSTLKPTGSNKKKEALEVGQVLGQFAKATPVAAVATLRMFERAFDGVVIKAEEWEMIAQSLMPPPAPPPGAAPPGAPPGALPPQNAGAPELQQLYNDAAAKGIPKSVVDSKLQSVANGKTRPN